MVTAPCVGSSYVVIDSGRCKGCRLCIRVCPKGIIDLTRHINNKGYIPVAVVDDRASECTGCAACALMCPDAAITVYRHERVLSQLVS